MKKDIKAILYLSGFILCISFNAPNTEILLLLFILFEMIEINYKK